ncbi:MAG: 50S ribosomal protein L2 [archaeon]
MGRRLKSQRRGKGTPKYIATINAKFNITYKLYPDVIKGQVIDFITDPVRSAPIAEVLLDDGRKDYFIAAEGVSTGDILEFGNKAKSANGNVLPLGEIIEGSNIFNIEKTYGDGGKFVRAGGQSAILINKKEDIAFVKLPSGKIKQFALNVRATLGRIAGGGRQAKPLFTAGNAYYAHKAKHKPNKIVRGVAQNSVDHPFGGGAHHVGHSKSTSRHDPAGRKVGAIASKRTGRKKKG